MEEDGLKRKDDKASKKLGKKGNLIGYSVKNK